MIISSWQNYKWTKRIPIWFKREKQKNSFKNIGDLIPQIESKIYRNTKPKNHSAGVLDCVLSSPKSDWEWLGIIVGGDHWSGSMRK